MENGLLALIEFLTQFRHKLNSSKTPKYYIASVDIYIGIGGWVGGWMDGWMDGWTDGRTDRTIDS